ncbi:uncharacterized protein LOC141905086 [Tubulanus polymorphus]|uniref:uncharacterized protein LOC141905086 n=1 Tax=Tubulanus polymorphus TaxID=672921 RepID=UPI003DA3D042
MMSGSDSDTSISDWTVVNRVGEIENRTDDANNESGQSSGSEFVNIDAELALYHRIRNPASQEISDIEANNAQIDSEENNAVAVADAVQQNPDITAESPIEDVSNDTTLVEEDQQPELQVKTTTDEERAESIIPAEGIKPELDKISIKTLSLETPVQTIEYLLETRDTETFPSPGSSFDIPEVDPIITLSRDTTDKESSPEIDDEGVDWTKDPKKQDISVTAVNEKDSDEIKEDEKDPKYENFPPLPAENELLDSVKSPDTDSDVEQIENDAAAVEKEPGEAGDVVHPLPDLMQSSRSSISSRFSFIQHRDDEESLPESDISLMNDSDAVDDEGDITSAKTLKNRQYLHKPNPDLNWSLNIVLSLVVALALGLGIGHAIGSAREARNLANAPHVNNLRDELSICLRKRAIVENQLHDYRQGEIKQQLESLTSKLGWLSSERDWLRTELKNRSDMIDALYTEKNSMQLEIKQLQEDTSQLNGKLGVMEAQKRTLLKENENLKTQLELIKSETGKSRHVENQVKQLQQDTANLNLRIVDLGSEKKHLMSLNLKLKTDTDNLKAANQELLRQKLLLVEKDQTWKTYYDKMTMKVDQIEAEKAELQRQIQQKKVTQPEFDVKLINPNIHSEKMVEPANTVVMEQQQQHADAEFKDEINELRFENEHLKLELAKHRYGQATTCKADKTDEEFSQDPRYLKLVEKIGKLENDYIYAAANCSLWKCLFTSAMMNQWELIANLTNSGQFRSFISSVQNVGRATEPVINGVYDYWVEMMKSLPKKFENFQDVSKDAWNYINGSPEVNEYIEKTKRKVNDISEQIHFGFLKFGDVLGNMFDGKNGREENDEKTTVNWDEDESDVNVDIDQEESSESESDTENMRKNDKTNKQKNVKKKKTTGDSSDEKILKKYPEPEEKEIKDKHNEEKKRKKGEINDETVKQYPESQKKWKYDAKEGRGDKFKMEGRRKNDRDNKSKKEKPTTEKTEKKNDDEDDKESKSFFDRFKPSKILKKLKEKVRKLNRKKWFSMDFDDKEDVWEEFTDFQHEHADYLGSQDKNWLNCQMEWWKCVFHVGRSVEDDCWERLLPWQRHVLKKWKRKKTSQKKRRTWKQKTNDGFQSDEAETKHTETKPENDDKNSTTAEATAESRGKTNWYIRRGEDREDGRHDSSWYFRRAEDREDSRRDDINWVFKRASDREKMHNDQEHYTTDSLKFNGQPQQETDHRFDEHFWRDEYENDNYDHND